MISGGCRAAPVSSGLRRAACGCVAAASRSRAKRSLKRFITSSLSAICFTCFGETKLTASMCRKPASTSCVKYSALYSVGMNSGSPCQASRGHSINFTGSSKAVSFFLRNRQLKKREGRKEKGNRQSMQAPCRFPFSNPEMFSRKANGQGELKLSLTGRALKAESSRLQHSGFEFGKVRIERGGFEGQDQRFAGVGGINDGVHPQAGGGVARVGLVFVGGAHGFVQFFLLLFIDLFAFALELLQLDFHERARGGIAAHHRITRGRPGKKETRVVRLPAHGVMARAEAAAANHRDLRDDGIGDRVHHLRARANDAAPFGILADHEAVHVVQEDKGDAVLVAVEDEPRGLFR